jgi:hypothetical protein
MNVFLKILLSFTLLTVLSSCDGSDSSDDTWWKQLIGQCQISNDQKGTFMAPPRNSQMVMTVDSLIANDPDHGTKWMAGVQKAVQKWNDFGQSARGADFFSIQTGDVPDDIRSGQFGNCQATDGGDANDFYLVIEKDPAHWTASGFNNNIPGATIRCYTNDDLIKQVIFVRPDLVRDEQMTSIFLHEMGHSLGLDHSCRDGGGPEFPNCKSFASDQTNPYVLAVMYPELVADLTFQSVFPIKEDLQANDIARAKCFY